MRRVNPNPLHTAAPAHAQARGPGAFGGRWRFVSHRVCITLMLASSACDGPQPTEPPADPGARTAWGAASPTETHKASPPRRWAARPGSFADGVQVTSLAVTPQRMLATTVGSGSDKVICIDELGRVQPFDPEFSRPADRICHLAVSAGHHAAFPDADVFVSDGPDLWRLRPQDEARDLVLTLAAPHGDIAGLCFDTTGAFRNELIVLSSQGSVFRVGAAFVAVEIATLGTGGSGPSVFSTPSGVRVVVAFRASGDVRALAPNGHVSRIGGWSGVTAALAFPDHARAFGRTGAALFVATSDGTISQFTLADVGAHAGALLYTSLYASGSGLATPVGTHFELDPWSQYRGPEIAAAFVQRQAVVPIDVDVVPGVSGGPLFLHDATPVPVALIAAPWFLPTSVDAASVRCAGAAPIPIGKKGFGTFVDVNGDGDLDLVLSFRPSEMAIGLPTTQVTLTGNTFTDDAFRGQASVRVSDGTLPPQRWRTHRGIGAIQR